MPHIQIPERFSRWDSADYLETEEDIALYFQYCQEDDTGNGWLVRAALGDIAKARYLNRLAHSAGLSRKDFKSALSPDGNPEFATVMKVIKALGLKLNVEHAGRVV